MVDYHKELMASLSKLGIPVHYEMALHSGLQTPCISYMELSNTAQEEGDTIGYSHLQYQVKVWATKVSDLQTYALKIDAALRPMGFKRVGCNEMFDNNSSMIQKIMTYEGLAFEDL